MDFHLTLANLFSEKQNMNQSEVRILVEKLGLYQQWQQL